MPTSRMLRAPVIGVVLAGARTQVTWEKPLDLSKETPIGLMRTPGTVIVENVTPTSCDVRSTAALPVGYIVVVVPAKLAAALVIAPWRDAVRFLGKWLRTPAGRKAFLNKVAEFVFNHASGAR